MISCIRIQSTINVWKNGAGCLGSTHLWYCIELLLLENRTSSEYFFSKGASGVSRYVFVLVCWVFFWSKSSNAQNSKEAQCEDLLAAVRQCALFEFTNVHDGANVYIVYCAKQQDEGIWRRV